MLLVIVDSGENMICVLYWLPRAREVAGFRMYSSNHPGNESTVIEAGLLDSGIFPTSPTECPEFPR